MLRTCWECYEKACPGIDRTLSIPGRDNQWKYVKRTLALGLFTELNKYDVLEERECVCVGGS